MPHDADQLIASRYYTAWQIIKSYWLSNHRLSAYFFLAIIVGLTIVLVGLDVAFNYWYNFFYNALQAYDKHGTVRLLVVFCLLATGAIVIAVYRYYVSQLFSLRWRRWLTHQFINRWLEKRGYYYLENFDKTTDNPDQRIQEDVLSLTNNSIDLLTGIVSSVATFFAFIYILWQLSGIITIPLGSYGSLQLPGYLVWVSLIYSAVGTFFTFRIGSPLVNLNFEQQRREATFRYAAMDLRSHSEHVALYKGEHHQKGILDYLFGRALENWYFIILRQKLLLWFTAGFNQVSVLLPLLVALPNYFDKVFLLGGLIQSLQAFGKVQDSLSFIVNSYSQIAQFQAVTRRLTTFVNHLSDSEIKAEHENRLVQEVKPENKIVTRDVTINTPDNKCLLDNISETFVHGSNYLLKGVSGLGKSTFLRAIAGIWPFAAGEIIYPKNQRIMFLSQKPYMPIGTLAEALLFPDKDNPDMKAELLNVLSACNLGHLTSHLGEVASWGEQLSPGEQQRVAIARVLLHKPDWVFLDESTSMLDLANEKYLYNLLKTNLPQCSIISIGHRPSLDGFHDHIIDLTKYSCQPNASQ